MLKSRDHIHILIDTHILKYVTYISLSGTKLVRLVMLHNQVPFLDPSDSNVAIFGSRFCLVVEVKSTQELFRGPWLG